MKVTSFLLVGLLLLVGWGVDLLPQFTPVIAKQRSVHYLMQNDGSEVEVVRMEGAYFRSSSGSVLDTMVETQGNNPGKHESVHMDSSTRRTYLLNHNLKTATLKQVSREPFRPVTLKAAAAIEEGVIQGLECLAMGVVSPHDPETSIGKVWWAKNARVVVKSESTFGLERIVRELYDIEFTEPAPAIFQFPVNYMIDDSEWTNWRRRESTGDEAEAKKE